MTFSTYQYSRFANQALAVNTAVTLGTVPASTQWIIKDISLTNTSGTAVGLTGFQIGGVNMLATGASLPPNQTLHWTGLFIANAGDTIIAQVATANVITVSINGQTGV